MNARALVPAVCLLASAALANDPPTPPGGFKIKEQLDLPITYSDGYKTRLDIRVPDATPGPNGWPVFMAVHGGGGSRKKSWVVGRAENMARQGYVTLAYDTGGEGQTVKLNPNRNRSEPERMRDVAEIFHFAEGILGARMDSSRLSMYGKSGGGKHALWGASYSERTLPLGSTLVTKMPKISAAFTDIQVLDQVEDMAPQGKFFKADGLAGMYERNGPNHPIVKMLLTGDYAGFIKWRKTDPGAWFLPLLRTSDVPVAVSYALDDIKHFVNTNADALATLKPGVPRRYFLLTGGHGAIGNNVEASFRADMVQRWSDRFLKSIANGVDQEPFAEIAFPPASPKDYLDNKSQWRHRRAEQWPPTGGSRFYLRGGNRLETSAPTGTESSPTIQHRIAPGYDIEDFAKDIRANAVLPNIPLVTKAFDTAPLTVPQELFGRATVELELTTNVADCQIQAAIYDVPPTGAPRYVTSGFAALRKVAPGRHRLRVVLGEVGYVFGAGHRVRLSLENLNLRQHPQNPHFFVIPDFTNADLAVHIDTAFPPRADIPLAPASAALTPRIATLSAGPGFRHQIRLDAGQQRAGGVYQLFVSGSGNWPGVVLPPRIPLNIDQWTLMGISLANTPVFASFIGLLDSNGRASAEFALPPQFAKLVIGQRLSFAALVVTPGPQLFGTNPIEVTIRP